MELLTIRSWAGAKLVGLPSDRMGLLMFPATLLLSASLLFAVQPLFAKMVLPYLGGTPSVWAVAMCFFQAMLLAGYCYAHLLDRWLSARWAVVTHGLVCLAAIATLPFGLPAWADNVAGGNSYFWLLAILTVGVGLPFFAVSANAPLLQAWFSKSKHPHANDPYFLYGASNLGSFVSLLSYPFLIEPMMQLDTQTGLWAYGFGVLLLMLMSCGLLTIAGQARPDLTEHIETSQGDAGDAFAAVTNTTRACWIGLAFVPSALMVAFTTHITTDIASAPFLWVIPLATFLATFVIVFRDKPLIPHEVMLWLHPYLVAAAVLFILLPNAGSLAVKGLVGFATFTVTTLVCHRVLYDMRPAANRLTEFYLLMSLGGVLGGVFAAIVAPQLFNTVVEYPLLILLGLFARPSLIAGVMKRDAQQWLRIVGACFAVAVAGAFLSAYDEADAVSITDAAMFGLALVSLALTLSMFVFAHRPGWLAKIAVVASLVVFVSSLVHKDGFVERSFFGVSRVTDTPDGKYRSLIHGSTQHGAERLLDDAGRPVTRPTPILYYHPEGPMARGFDVARAGADVATAPLNVGVIGLGTGSLACYLQGGETVTYYEIDQVVVDIARDATQFTYLSRCAPNANIVLGDARLTLARSEAQAYDYLVVDAFSSDAVPVHLLTREALELYLSRVTANGLVAIHISNRYLELESVVAATSQSLGGVYSAMAQDRKTSPGLDTMPSDVMFLSRSKETIAKVEAWQDVRAARSGVTAAWSDNYADVLGAVRRRMLNGK
jgi:spermidine synthase